MVQFTVWITYKYSESSLKIINTVQEKWWPKLPCLCCIALATAMSLSDRVEGFPFLFNGIIFLPAQSAAQPETTVVKVKKIQKANHKPSPEWATCKHQTTSLDESKACSLSAYTVSCTDWLVGILALSGKFLTPTTVRRKGHSCSDVSNPRAAFGLPHPGILRVTNAFS